MTNFFIEDQFYDDLSDFVDRVFDQDKETIENLPDDWEEIIELAELQPIFQYQSTDLLDVLCDANEERFPEDPDSTDAKILNALEESIDFEKLNRLLPRLYFGANKLNTITKKDLLEAL